MLNTQALNINLDSAAFPQVPQVVDKFKIRDASCLAILLTERDGSSLINKILISCLSSLNIYSFSEVTRFPVNDHLCIIVEIEVNAKSTQSDLPKLLTERELQVANLVAQGQPNKQIAKHLHISEWTVATHLRRIYAKLDVDSRAAMVYKCFSFLQ